MASCKALLVCGQMRSGTSLLANFLNAQKSISVHRDRATVLFRDQHKVSHPLDFCCDIPLSQLEAIQLSIDKNLDNIFDEKEEDLKHSLSHIKKKYRIRININGSSNYRDIIHQCLDKMANAGDSYVGTKVTLCEHNVQPFLSQLDSKVIGIVRNPLNVIKSLVSDNFSDGRMAPLASTYIRSWKRGVTRLLDCEDNNFLLIRFEDFVSDKTKTCQSISSFLGLNIDTNIEELYDYDLPWGGNSSFQKNLTAIDDSVIKRTSELPKNLQDEILSTCRDEMLRLGYAG